MNGAHVIAYTITVAMMQNPAIEAIRITSRFDSPSCGPLAALASIKVDKIARAITQEFMFKGLVKKNRKLGSHLTTKDSRCAVDK